MIKDFSKFLNEEITIKGNTGVPGEENRSEPSYLRDVERKGQAEISDVRNPHPLFMEIMQLADRSKVLTRGKESELEQFAEKIIRDVYPGILDNVDLDIKFARDGSEVNDFMQEENEKKLKKQQEREEQEEEESEEDNDQKEETPKPKDSTRPSNDRDLKLEVDKRKIANAIIQGEAKNTKNIIEMPECRDGLKSILGDAKGQELHTNLLRIAKIANKLDWVIPVNVKAQMMENAPQGMAGAVSVDWEGCDNGSCKKNAEDIIKNLEDGEEMEDMGEEMEELFSHGKPTIRARGIDFSMLLHETVKGIYELIARAGLPQDEEITKNVMLNTSSFADEAEDFKYGPYIAADLRDFVNKNPNIDKYPNIREHVFGKLMLMPAAEFLSAMKNILMGSPEGRQIVDRLVSEVISELDEYERQMTEFDAKQKLGETDDDGQPGEGSDDETKDVPEWWKEDEESDIDKLINKSNNRELSELSPKEIQELIDDALDKGDFEEVKKLSAYLKEGKEIYLREIERINEGNQFHTRRNNI